MKKVFAILSVVFILCLTVLPLFALNVYLNIEIVLINDVKYINSVTVRRSYESDPDTVYSDTYTNQVNSFSYIQLQYFGISAGLTSQALQDGYTGVYVYLYDLSDMGNPLDISIYTNLSSNYVDNLTEFYFTQDVSNAKLELYPAKSQEIDFGTPSDYQRGRQDQLRIDTQKMNELQDRITELTASSGGQYDTGYSNGYTDGFQASEATRGYLEGVVTTGINGFADTVKQFFDLQVLGIKVYQVVLIVCMIPLFIFLFKVVVHKNG